MARRSADMSGIMDWWRKLSSFTECRARPAGPPPPTNIDLYDVLRITPGASHDEIKQAFRSLALMFHPDRNPDDPVAAKRYVEITTAYAILGDEVQRAAYDRLRAKVAPPPPPPSSNYGIVPREEEEAVQEPKKEVAKTPLPKPVSNISLWEVLCSKGEEETEQTFEMFTPKTPRPPKIPSAENQFDWMTPSHKRVPLTPGVDIPPPNELFYFIEHEWPLEWVWDIARNGRHTQEFYKTKAIAIDALGGAGDNPAEWDLAELFGIPTRQVDEFVRHRGRQAFFGEILFPILDQVTQIMGKLKPVDLPGQFFAHWDSAGKVMLLIYAEDVGRRPWE